MCSVMYYVDGIKPQKTDTSTPFRGIQLRLISVHFGSVSRKALKLILKSPRFVPFGSQSDPIVDLP